jgi:Leucine-rich repeat (LRR) protein
LQHAHERGLVHRDIKPQNLLVVSGGVVSGGKDKSSTATHHSPLTTHQIKILDMGLARLDEPSPGQDASTTMTQEGVVMGTPDYIAPEQALDAHAADIRADLYSLGCTFYYLLAGHVPFPGGTFMEKINKHSFDEPTPLAELHPGIPVSVTEIVSKLMAKKPEDRFQTPGELAQALEALGNIMEDVKEAPPTARKDRAPADSRMDTAEVRKNTFASALSYMAKRDDTVAFGLPPGRKPRRRLSFFMAGGVLAMIVAVVVIVVMSPSGNQNEPRNKNEKPIGGKPPVKRHPVDEAWLKQVAAMPTEEKLAAVVAKLKEQNPNFDGKMTHITSDSGLVTELRVFTDDLKDISAVRALEGLQKLDCIGSNWGNGLLDDLSPLEGLKLSSLDCSGTGVADLSPLKGMPLRTLACNGTPVKDLAPLAGMPLTTLSLDGTQVSDLEPLKELKLTTLRIAATPVSSLSSLKNMKLTSLACNNTKVTSLAPLKDMPLRELTCDFRPDRDLPILRSIKTLQKINGEPVK